MSPPPSSSSSSLKSSNWLFDGNTARTFVGLFEFVAKFSTFSKAPRHAIFDETIIAAFWAISFLSAIPIRRNESYSTASQYAIRLLRFFPISLSFAERFAVILKNFRTYRSFRRTSPSFLQLNPLISAVRRRNGIFDHSINAVPHRY